MGDVHGDSSDPGEGGWEQEQTNSNSEETWLLPYSTSSELEPPSDGNPDTVTVPNHWLFGDVFLIEVVAFLYLLAGTIAFSVFQYYIIHRVTEANPEDTKSQVLDKVAGQNVYFTLSFNASAVIPTVFYGVISDKYGRKIVLLISILGNLIKCVLVYTIIHFHAQLNLFHIAFIIEGLCGSYGTFLTAMFSAVADITSEGIQRNMRVTWLMAVASVATAAGSTSAGFWTRYVSYEAPIILSSSSVGLSLLFLIFALPESNKRGGQSQISAKQQFLGFVRFFTVESDILTRRILVMCLFIFMLASFNFQSNLHTQLLYLKGSPFEWSDDKIAIYIGLAILCAWIFIVALTKLFEHCIRDVTFAVLGAVSAVAGFTVQGLASSDNMLYIAAAMFLLRDNAFVMMRTIMSRHAPAAHQGSLFASVAVVELVNGTIAGVASLYLFKLGLRYYYGLHSLVFAGLAFVSLVGILVLRYIMILSDRRKALINLSERLQEERNASRTC